MGEWVQMKEPVGRLTTLQKNAVEVPEETLSKLKHLTGVPSEEARGLVAQVRTASDSCLW